MAPHFKFKFGESPLFDSGTDSIAVYDSVTFTYRAPSLIGLAYNTALNTLTATGSFTNTLLTGSAGGQTVIGGTANGENLTFEATGGGNGTVYFGGVGGMNWYEAGGAFTVGSTAHGSEIFNVNTSVNGFAGASIVNGNAGTSKATVLYLYGSTLFSGAGMQLTVYPSNYTTAGLQSKLQFLARNTSGLILGTDSSAGISFITNSSEAIGITSGGLVGIGNITAGALVDIGASTTSRASVRVRSGTAPTSPNEGDLWADSTQKALIAYSDGMKQAMSNVIFTQTANKTVTNTVTETSIIGTGIGTLTLPANFFVIGKTIRLRIGGVYSTPLASTPSLVIKVKIASSIIATITTSALLSGATDLEFDIEVLITCRTTGVTGSVAIHGDIEYATGVAGTIAVDPLNDGGVAFTVDTTASSLLDVTVTWDTNTTSRIAKSTVTVVEVLN